jgi:hypothetical protein
MANDMVSNDNYSEKSKTNELIYFATILCETLSELEPTLVHYFPNDHRIKLLISIKNKWIERFNHIIH